MAALQHQLDYPGINCRQCGENVANDEVDPECQDCPVDGWDQLTRQILALYDKCSPGDRLEPGLIIPAMDSLGLAVRDRRPVRDCLTAIHRQLRKHYQQQQQENQGHAN